MAGSNTSGDYPGTNLPENIADWTPEQRAMVGQALGVYGNPKITSGLSVLANNPPAGEVTKADLNAEKNPTSSVNTGLSEAQIEKEFANDPWSQLGAGLAKTLEEEQAPIEKAVSGQDTGSQDKAAMTSALTTLGLSPGSGAAQWLNSNIATANKADQPMQAAMAAYGKAYETGQKGVDTALTNMGQMNQLGVNTAPEQTWLQDIAQHIQSNITYGQVVPSWAQSLPDALKYYLAQSGGTSSSGTMPLTSLTYPGSKNAGPASSLAGVAPGSTATPAALSPGSSPAAS